MTLPWTIYDSPLDWERTIFASIGPNDAANSVAQKQITEKTYPKITYDDNVVTLC